MTPMVLFNSGARRDAYSQEAGPKIAAILSVMETCKRLQINLRKYLGDVLPKLPSWLINEVAALSPLNWKSSG